MSHFCKLAFIFNQKQHNGENWVNTGNRWFGVCNKTRSVSEMVLEKDRILQQKLSPQKYIRFMRFLGVVFLLVGTALMIFGNFEI